MKQKSRIIGLLLLILVPALAGNAFAGWKKDGTGYAWYDASGTKYSGTYDPSAEAGIASINGKDVLLRKDGTVIHGFLTMSNGDRYFGDANGIVQKSTWIKLSASSNVRKYRASSSGLLYRSKIVKIGAYSYGFDQKGIMVTGKKTYSGSMYFFMKSGRMAKKTYIVSGDDRYYAQKSGKLAVSKWVGKYYFGKKGRALKNGWKDDRYLGSDGKYLTGLRQIGNYLYYFDPGTGKKVTGISKTINGKTYYFNAEGKAAPDSSVETTYYSDPSVKNEILLAAIIYAESGNQPYYGQLAVGLVITNRVRSASFPNTIREVIYAKQQFEPARTGSLTRYLKNPDLVSDSCRQAAKKVLAMYKSNAYTITVNKKKISMKGYYFFMTPAAYQRLGLTSKYVRLEGHVFFKDWSR